MAPRTIRRLVIVVFVAGIAGMIVGSIADNNGVAITFGLITAAAAVGLILVTAVAGPEAFRPGARRGAACPDAEPIRPGRGRRSGRRPGRGAGRAIAWPAGPTRPLSASWCGGP